MENHLRIFRNDLSISLFDQPFRDTDIVIRVIELEMPINPFQVYNIPFINFIEISFQWDFWIFNNEAEINTF